MLTEGSNSMVKIYVPELDDLWFRQVYPIELYLACGFSGEEIIVDKIDHWVYI